ncbi:CHAT domain-containing protein [Scytonema sp. NUACC26]|uniref:CHAT domain-containing protein n=1 Tax=Scytonema sp. NUACC26 TaxID=3140176 RepID=UPI0034DCB8A0
MLNPKYLLKIIISTITISLVAINSTSINHAIASEKSQNQLEMTAENKDNSPAQQPNKSSLVKVAQQQNATLVQYSIIAHESIVDGKPQTQESELYIWVIKPNAEVEFRKVDLKAWEKIEKISFLNLLRRNRRAFSARSTDIKGAKVEPEPKENNLSPDLQKLHQILIKPIADFIPQKPEEKVIFIPQGEFLTVPFTALKDTNGKYLIEKHTISTAPSIQVLDLLYQRKIKRKGEQAFVPKNITGDELLIVGNPTAPKTPLKAGEEICKSPPLPGTEKEAKAIAQIFKAQALIGDAATETAIAQKMPQAKIIHLAANAFPDNCQKENSPDAIALASSDRDDGWLRTEEIQNMKLKADLVVLTGCDTALGKITGDGVIGLSRGFLVAGADSVIGSLWDVDDMATAFLITEFYVNLSRNTDKADGLRQAMLETMKKYPNPRDWAAFTLIGLL